MRLARGPLAAIVVIWAALAGMAESGAAQEPVARLVFQNPKVAVFELTLPPRFEGEVHTNPHDEGAYVLEGELTIVTVPSGREVLRPGDYAWAPKGTLHKSLNTTDKPTRFLVIVLKDS
ncbi:MAG TPA: cupin domain-containing protein [Candidatus Limnocylindrales bacterium]|nr:cupin domain-containing protein [Candidatus Limnocylindrales bacterium]